MNCFAPSETPYFHTDGKGITFLYYPNLEWNLQDGGETQFYVDGNILGVPPAPNRLVMFDGEIVHRAHHLGTDIGLRLQLSTHRINNRKSSHNNGS